MTAACVRERLGRGRMAVCIRSPTVVILNSAYSLCGVLFWVKYSYTWYCNSLMATNASGSSVVRRAVSATFITSALTRVRRLRVFCRLMVYTWSRCEAGQPSVSMNMTGWALSGSAPVE